MIVQTKNLGKKYPISLCEGNGEFWALRGIDLTMNEGEAIGLIGRNGSGKSTLLKLLSRVTCPSEGKIELFGRVGALLEVGTGFHLELTGRENVYLSGAILGMRRKEVKSHFEEIIAFSEVEPFLDIPVKKYSSGMFLRLAFSVMAHLKSDLLIIDEILSVGDKEFQKKALKKIHALIKEGRAVILAGHQLDTLENLCSHLIWLEDGVVKLSGETHSLLKTYQCKAALQT